LIYICVAGVLVSFGGSIYTGIKNHRDESKPKPLVFPTPATQGGQPSVIQPAQTSSGGLPTPAH
jgi:hypothetical protein